jgi:hypothetical protein
VETSSHDSSHPSRDAPAAAPARRLIAEQCYFGVEAATLRRGLGRSLARLSRQPTDHDRIDAHGLADDFEIDSGASAALLSVFLTGGLLYPDGSGRYRPTRLFHDYAVARVVAPLERARAKALIDKSCRVAARINAEWAHIPFRIETIAVSGAYMSCREQFAELSLSLVLTRRPKARAEAKPRVGKQDALREVADALQALSSFIVVHVVGDRAHVQRPFSVVFQATEPLIDVEPAKVEPLRDLGASIGRWLAFR